VTTEQLVLSALEREVLEAFGDIESPTIDHLRTWLNVPRRLVEEAVENLRLAGHPVIGDAHGLHLARDSQELAAYIEARRRRLVTVYAGTRALRPTLARMRAEERDDDAENREWVRHWEGAA